VEQKLEILREAEVNGVNPTLRKYNLSTTVFYRWREKLETEGRKGLEPKYRTIDPEKKRLEEENTRLKKLLAEKELEIEIKGELLKKIEKRQGKLYK
jgi:putative transposase